jgi:hypothetical protein
MLCYAMAAAAAHINATVTNSRLGQRRHGLAN